MHASKEQLQDAWLDAYLTGPVWRFVLDAGVCGDSCYAGILVPSVDRVGRYFPLTVVAPVRAGHCPLDVDAFDEGVANLREPLAAESASESASLMRTLGDSAFPLNDVRWHVPLDSAQSLQRAVNVLAYKEMSRGLKPLTLWWTEGSQALGASWLALRGLPEASAFTAMLSGNWTGSGWTSVADVGARSEARPVTSLQSLVTSNE